ncbi:MAG TPA: tRNA epoxyqueuosine(34) reductase QueG [Candidatus Acidoferrales bacterium]|jgi:epoxyqueuosine reductase|nr:tRNA epoxyqueuosine(34) reductase QueG [Candidatus Acidoferrales bacterium]
MKEQIRQRAMELGFDDCRFAGASPPDRAKQFQNWVAEGKFGEMAWIEKNAAKRIEPQKVLSAAKTAICLAASYGTNGPEKPLSPGRCIVARYARFSDYHDVLGERLKLLSQFVNELGGGQTRSLWYVDTGPILERDFAQRAGIGFAGKHTNLISRRFGNWIFLAEILTTLEIEPDAPEKNHCGKCSRCIAACPTTAITAPFQLDARRCISYLTIELKGLIPEEFRRAIGNRIYGCDDCLAVCPWNKFAREGRLMKSHAREDLEQPDLIELLSLDDKQFKARFAGSPILRTKRRGLLRNVCVALGNVGDKSALVALEKASQDSEPLIVEHARWAIQQITSRCNAP